MRLQPTYCNPIKENVNSAIRIVSVEPLMAGWPAHDAAISTPSSSAFAWSSFSSSTASAQARARSRISFLLLWFRALFRYICRVIVNLEVVWRVHRPAIVPNVFNLTRVVNCPLGWTKEGVRMLDVFNWHLLELLGATRRLWLAAEQGWATEARSLIKPPKKWK